MIHSATASDMLDTSAKAPPTSLGNPMEGTDLPTVSSAAVKGGEICRWANEMKSDICFFQVYLPLEAGEHKSKRGCMTHGCG